MRFLLFGTLLALGAGCGDFVGDDALAPDARGAGDADVGGDAGARADTRVPTAGDLPVAPPLIGVVVDAQASGSPPNRGITMEPTVRELRIPALEEVALPPRPDDVIGNGWGMGLVDADGDLDLDVFLSGAAEGPSACLFENVSTPGAVAFAERPLLCLRDVDVVGAFAVDVDTDGRHELVVSTTEGAVLYRFAPELEVVELPDGEPVCVASNVQSVDIDSDGDLDLVAACQTLRPVGASATRVTDRAWTQRAGQWSALAEPWLRDGNTLALGVVDRNDDGRLDLAVVVDTLSGRDARNTTEEPGGWLTRCAPSADCRFELTPFREDATAWGSFMSFGVVRLNDVGPHIVLTDWGPNRLLALGENGSVDRARERSVSLTTAVGEDRFHWGIAVEDWDLDGDDDLYIAQGAVPGLSPERAEAHFDALLLQDALGWFRTREAPPLTVDGETRRHRGVARADLDGDGVPELLIAPLEGTYRLLSITPGTPPQGCTLVPRPRYALADRAGWAIGPSAHGPWSRRDVAGQHQTGTSPFAFSSLGEGWLRFASGARVPFRCEGHGAQRLEEPEWLSVEWSADAITLSIDTEVRGPVEDVDVAVRTDSAVVRRPARSIDGRFEVAREPADEAIMVRLDGRWVDRWFPLEP